MKRILLKALQKINRLRYPGLEKDYVACIASNHYSRLHELKFVAHDYLVKKRYKKISYHGEFQQELTFVLPYAYWHYCNGTLSKTQSSKDTRFFYFFSPDHEEHFEKREWKGWSHSFDIPNMGHCNTFDYSKWRAVPLKDHYRNNRYVFDKPTLVIANKYNIEWGKPPVNFLDLKTLDTLFSRFKDHYQIIYNRPKSHHIVNDHSEILELHEREWIRRYHPEVITLEDLYDKRPPFVKAFNHLQLLVYANCENFISVHGGTAALASYFGGVNIILSKMGFEHIFREYDTIFPKLSGARILHATSEAEVISLASQQFQGRALVQI
jgi:hypothetical protein